MMFAKCVMNKSRNKKTIISICTDYSMKEFRY